MLEFLVGVVVFVVMLAFVAGVTLVVLRARSQNTLPSGRWPFSLRRPLSDPEQMLYHRLCQALPDHMVLAQVGLSRFLAVKKGHDPRAWNNRINRMSVDFLVCNRDASVIAAIELDDASHQRPDRVSAYEKKERALEAAGLPLLRWRVDAMPDEAAIHAALASESTGRRNRTTTSQSSDSAAYRPA
jgi:hypothetical protein